MAKNKTQPTEASIDAYIASRASSQQARDCKRLIDMMTQATGSPPQMWGPSIVGFGTYTYTYASGRSGNAPLTGFALRGREIVVYLSCEGEHQLESLARLGKHRMTKACLYFKTLADLDCDVLESLVAESIADVRRRYPNES